MLDPCQKRARDKQAGRHSSIAGRWTAREPRNTSLMAQCFERTTSAPTVARLIEIRDRVGNVAAVGIKTMFYSTHRRVREMVSDPAFGRPVMTVRYRLHVPQSADLPITDKDVRSCLGHLWHPFGVALVSSASIQ